MSDDNPNMLQWALSYAHKKIPVFPIWPPFSDACTCGNPDCGSRAKHPIETMVPHGVLDATLDNSKIMRWWKERPDASIGIACGFEFFVVDVDPKHGGFESLEQMESKHGKLPGSIRAKSGGGGLHIFLKMPKVAVKGRIGLRPGIDIKTKSGYVVAPPSMHISGNRYEFSETKDGMQESPAWLLELMNGPENNKPRFDVSKALQGVPHGQRYYALLSLSGKLRRADVPLEEAGELIKKCAANCNPPAKEEDARKILEKAYRTWLPAEEPKELMEANPIEIKTLSEVTTAYINKIKASGGEKYVTTGIDSLDHAIGGGVDYGEMTIIAARPSHGKSAFALNLLDAQARVGIPTAIVSEEMSAMMLGKRTVQFASDIMEYQWQSKMEMVENQIDKHFADREVCYVLERCKTAERTVEAISDLAANKGVKVVAIDYAQLLGSKGSGRYEQITQTSMALRRLANSSHVSLIVLCQLNRSIVQRDKFIPRLDDLKDSGQLEQDADTVLSLVWPWYLDNSNTKHEYQVWVNKNRNRPIISPMVQCRFDPTRQMFTVTMGDEHNVVYEPRWHQIGD